MKSITPFLWFHSNAEEAVAFYTRLFPESETSKTVLYGEDHPFLAGQVMTIEFRLRGQTFVALNGGPHYSFTPAISFVIDCASDEEVNHYWDALAEGGEEMMCGWVTDRFGVTWQVVPSILQELMGHPDKERAGQMIQAMLKMKKLSYSKLLEAFEM